MKEKTFSCYFAREIFIEAKNEDEARDKSWKLMMSKTSDLLNLETVVEIGKEKK